MINAGRPTDNRFIQSRGRTVLWERAVYAPTSRKNSYAKSFDTTAGGDLTGNLYLTPMSIKVLTLGVTKGTGFDVYAAWNEGNCRITIPAMYPVGQDDKITMTEFTVRWKGQMTRGTGFLALVDDLIAEVDPIPYPYCTELLYVLDEDGRSYEVGTEVFLRQADGRPWIMFKSHTTDTDPIIPFGKTYSVKLNINPQWLVAREPLIRSYGPGNRMQTPLMVQLSRHNSMVESLEATS